MSTARSSIRLVPLLVSIALGLVATVAAAQPSGTDLSRRGTHVLAQSVQQDLERGIAVSVASGTRLTNIGRSEVPLKTNHPATSCHAFVVDAGRVEVRVPEGDPPASSVLIRTPHRASFVSLGGVAEVIVGENETTVVVRQGKALVAKGNDWQVFGSGKVLVLSRSRAQAREVIGTPTISVERSLLMTRQGETTDAAIHVDPVAGADHYEIELVGDDQRPPVSVPRFLAHAPWIPIPALGPGRYRVRVRAVDALGVAGSARTSPPLRVVPFDVPDGAVVDGSTIWLSPGNRVRLVDPAGLELTYGTANRYFIDAPGDIGVAGGNPTVARIRVKGTNDEAQLQLRPRPAAQLRVGSRRFDETSHQVEIELTVFDAAGRVTTSAPVSKSVWIDGREVPLDWTQQGASQRTAFRVPEPKGPSKVEVRVEDEVGPIAEETVEITRSN